MGEKHFTKRLTSFQGRHSSLGNSVKEKLEKLLVIPHLLLSTSAAPLMIFMHFFLIVALLIKCCHCCSCLWSQGCLMYVFLFTASQEEEDQKGNQNP